MNIEQIKKKIFLIGGKDLEMQEIKNLLNRFPEEVTVIDKNLSWGASLSSYAHELDAIRYWIKTKRVPGDAVIYGIELSESGVEDIPGNYVRIDHHNDYADRKSSIEQVAEILGVPMTRDMRLVGANDSGYIPAMKAMGASDDEIAVIRRRDRAAQGVSYEDEEVAAEAISQMRKFAYYERAPFEDRHGISPEKIHSTMAIVRVPDSLSKFSPITDALFGKSDIFVYNGNELCYYGPHAHEFGKVTHGFSREFGEAGAIPGNRT